MMKFRLKVKMGRNWKLGWNFYNSYEEAKKRADYMISLGHKVKVVDSKNWM